MTSRTFLACLRASIAAIGLLTGCGHDWSVFDPETGIQRDAALDARADTGRDTGGDTGRADVPIDRPDVPVVTDVPTDVPVIVDVPVVDVPVVPDVPVMDVPVTDVPIVPDVPVMVDAADVRDVPVIRDAADVTDAPVAMDVRSDVALDASTDVSTDVNTDTVCGRMGQACCADPAPCTTGLSCTSIRICGTCPATMSTCSGHCVDLQSDDFNCGVCGTVCGAGRNCRTGRCR